MELFVTRSMVELVVRDYLATQPYGTWGQEFNLVTQLDDAVEFVVDFMGDVLDFVSSNSEIYSDIQEHELRSMLDETDDTL
jgi:hypothetical protein